MTPRLEIDQKGENKKSVQVDSVWAREDNMVFLAQWIALLAESRAYGFSSAERQQLYLAKLFMSDPSITWCLMPQTSGGKNIHPCINSERLAQSFTGSSNRNHGRCFMTGALSSACKRASNTHEVFVFP